MMNRSNSKQYPNPKFRSIEEEDRYWKNHSPLDEGFEGEEETSEQKRSSFLSIRMNGDELSQLKDTATKLGLAPSTYARLILTSTSNQPSVFVQPAFNGLYTSTAACDGTTQNPGICIVDAGSINISEDVVKHMLGMIQSTWKCRVVTPNDADYKQAEHLVRT